MQRIPRIVLVLLAVLALTAAACGGGDDGGDDGGGDSTESTDTGGGDDSGGGSTAVTVSAADFSFSPEAVNVPAGAEITVTFENNGEAPHTMTAEDVGLNIEADPGATEEGSFTAPDSGSVEFQCTIHPQMTGEIAVDGSAKADTGDSNKEDSGYDY